MPVLTRGLGWLPDVPSIKDYTQSHARVTPLLQKTAVPSRISRSATAVGVTARGAAAAAAPAPRLGPSVDLRPFCSPIVDQGALGSCTANAAAGAV